MSRILKIVTFGNSLTVGYQSPSPDNPMGKPTPYGRFLKELIGPSVEMIIKGVSGELTGEMLLRLDPDVISKKPHYAIILGGANDLGWGTHPSDIVRNLVTMYERTRSAGIQPISVTVPSIRGYDPLIPPRQVLNNLITEYCKSQQQHAVDLFTATAEPGTLRLAEKYSNDGLHLTTEGYRLLAELLYNEVFKAVL
jgi:lysophospholipase L1-like esterase